MKTQEKAEKTSQKTNANVRPSTQAPAGDVLQAYSEGRLHRQTPNNLSAFTASTNRTGMPDQLKSGIEQLSGYNMDNVRVHYNSAQPAQLRALAYTQGTDIHIAPGQERHLPHEAWHVVQQMQGRVQPTRQLKGIQVNDNDSLEREADVMGKRAETVPHFNIHAPSQKIYQGYMNTGITQLVNGNNPPEYSNSIAPVVYYGAATIRSGLVSRARQEKMQKNLLPDHVTVDTLNAAIGIDTRFLENCGTLGVFRVELYNKLETFACSDHVLLWRNWLKDRMFSLLMPELTAEQCRFDIGYEGAQNTLDDVPLTIEGFNQNWPEHSYDYNFAKNLSFNDGEYTRGSGRLQLPKEKWFENKEKFLVARKMNHNTYVESLDKIKSDRAKTKLPQELINATMSWMANPISKKFFRMTSLLGLDFFASIGRHIVFVTSVMST